MAGKKRGSGKNGERLEFEPKRLKYRDLESVFRSEGVNIYNAKYWKNKQASNLAHSSQKEVSQVTEDTVNSNALQSGKTGKDRCQVLVSPAIISLDLDTNVNMSSSFVSDNAQTSFKDTTRLTLDSTNVKSSKEVNLDLNSEDVSNSVYHVPFNTDKCNDQLKSRDSSECGSTCGPLVEKDPMNVWKQMKQNGFMSTFHSDAPVPKPRARKSKAEIIKKRMDTARRDQVDRFAKIAAPSGLLNGLNPGIINNVRNSRQVRSKIEALVRSVKYEVRSAENKPETSRSNTERIDLSDRKALENLNLSECTEGDSDFYYKGNSLSFLKLENEEDTPVLKQSSSEAMALENVSSLSNEESSNQANVSILSLRAANVASEWLKLLHQDIKGRLAALQRSKNRVQAVIETELPFLMSREFSSNKENAPCRTNLSVSGPSDGTTDLHKARWSALFDQMDKSLGEEEKQLKSWLSQVNAMQLHCGHDLFNSTESSGMQQLGTSEIDCRIQKGSDSQRGLEVKAAAAAFYSTCNFIQSSENLTSF